MGIPPGVNASEFKADTLTGVLDQFGNAFDALDSDISDTWPLLLERWRASIISLPEGSAGNAMEAVRATQRGGIDLVDNLRAGLFTCPSEAAEPVHLVAGGILAFTEPLPLLTLMDSANVDDDQEMVRHWSLSRANVLVSNTDSLVPGSCFYALGFVFLPPSALHFSLGVVVHTSVLDCG